MKIRSLLQKRVLLLVFIVFISTTIIMIGDDEKTGEIWKKIKDKPNPALMDNFELLEGFPLFVNGKDIGTDATALAAVFKYEFSLIFPGSESAPGFFSAAAMWFSTELYKKLEKEHPEFCKSKDAIKFWEYVNKKLMTKAIEKTEKARQAVEANKENWKTRGVKDSYLLELYLGGLLKRESIVDAVREFAENSYLDVAVQTEAKLNWMNYKEAIDKKIPVILQKGNKFFVGVGYYYNETDNYLIIYDPEKAEYHISTGEENISSRSKEYLKRDDVEESVKNMIRYRIRAKFTKDTELKIKGSLPSACLIQGNPPLFHAYYISDWKINEIVMEEKYDELLEVLKIKDTVK